jgi:pyridoxine kinase
VWYSHHKGHPGWFGTVTPIDLFENFLQYALQAEHLRVTTVLSGYLGTAAQASALARALPQGVRYVCDPVMGDFPSGQYVSDALVRAYRHDLVPRASILLPNPFELGLLTGTTCSTLPEVVLAARDLLARYATLQVVVVTGLPSDGVLHLCAVSRQQDVYTHHPLVDYRVSGSGDAFSAAWLALYLHSGDLHASLEQAGQFLYGVVQRTAREQQRELQLIPELPRLRQAARQLAPLPE